MFEYSSYSTKHYSLKKRVFTKFRDKSLSSGFQFEVKKRPSDFQHRKTLKEYIIKYPFYGHILAIIQDDPQLVKVFFVFPSDFGHLCQTKIYPVPQILEIFFFIFKQLCFLLNYYCMFIQLCIR